jgi:hypothetical protein
MGHGAWGMGHGTWGMGHGTRGMGRGTWGAPWRPGLQTRRGRRPSSPTPGPCGQARGFAWLWHVSVVSATGNWDILAVNTLGDEVFATPAIADGRIYIRTKSMLYAFGK